MLRHASPDFCTDRGAARRRGSSARERAGSREWVAPSLPAHDGRMTGRRWVTAIASVVAVVVDLGERRLGASGPVDRRARQPVRARVDRRDVRRSGVAWSVPAAAPACSSPAGPRTPSRRRRCGRSMRPPVRPGGRPSWAATPPSPLWPNGLVYLRPASRRPAPPAAGPRCANGRPSASRSRRGPSTAAPSRSGDVIVDGPLAFISGYVDSTTTVFAVNPAGAPRVGRLARRRRYHPRRRSREDRVRRDVDHPLGGGGTDLPLLTGYRESDGAR